MTEQFAIKPVAHDISRMRAGSNWMGQKVLFHTVLFGKEYYWLQDIEGTIYLAHVGNDGLPRLA